MNLLGLLGVGSPLGWLKILGTLGIAAAIAFVVVDWRAKSADVAVEKACEVAIGKTGGDVSGCPAVLAKVATAARAAQACDDALASSDGFAVDQTCSTAVKTLVARDSADAASLASALVAEHQADADRDAAISRAEARAQDMDKRVISDAKTIAAAPRNADGTVRCDSQCLRDIAQ